MEVIETNFFDKEEVYTDCMVQVLTNTVTGEVSVGWSPTNDWRIIKTISDLPERTEEVIGFARDRQLIGHVYWCEEDREFVCESETDWLYGVSHWRYKSANPEEIEEEE